MSTSASPFQASSPHPTESSFDLETNSAAFDSCPVGGSYSPPYLPSANNLTFMATDDNSLFSDDEDECDDDDDGGGSGFLWGGAAMQQGRQQQKHQYSAALDGNGEFDNNNGLQQAGARIGSSIAGANGGIAAANAVSEASSYWRSMQSKSNSSVVSTASYITTPLSDCSSSRNGSVLDLAGPADRAASAATGSEDGGVEDGLSHANTSVRMSRLDTIQVGACSTVSFDETEAFPAPLTFTATSPATSPGDFVGNGFAKVSLLSFDERIQCDLQQQQQQRQTFLK